MVYKVAIYPMLYELLPCSVAAGQSGQIHCWVHNHGSGEIGLKQENTFFERSQRPIFTTLSRLHSSDDQSSVDTKPTNGFDGNLAKLLKIVP